MTIPNNNNYTDMQRKYYASHAKPWDSSQPTEPGFVRCASQNSWPEYEYLFNQFSFPLDDKVMLDFGCGPGRNLAFYGHRFKRIDGADLDPILLQNAQKWAAKHNAWYADSRTYCVDGVSLNGVPSDTYDMVMSTICLQHICVHEIRFQILKEFLRVLKPDGWITIQMGFGSVGGCFAAYHDNDYGAASTNGARDVGITDAEDLKRDLDQIGFRNFQFDIRPGDNIGHANSIFFRAQR